MGHRALENKTKKARRHSRRRASLEGPPTPELALPNGSSRSPSATTAFTFASSSPAILTARSRRRERSLCSAGRVGATACRSSQPTRWESPTALRVGVAPYPETPRSGKGSRRQTRLTLEWRSSNATRHAAIETCPIARGSAHRRRDVPLSPPRFGSVELPRAATPTRPRSRRPGWG